MNRYLIIADDFTGANDTGVQMCRRGLNTSVIFAGRSIPADASSVVIDTESRGMEGETAYSVTAAALKQVDFFQYKYVIKKVDSTLRGNVAEETKAVDEAFGSELVIFAPALPDLGRTTINGRHHLKGVPILETELAKDPQKPVTEDNLRAIFEKVYHEPVTHVPLDTVRYGTIDFAGGRVFTFDAEKNSDLQSIIKAAKQTGRRILWVGTAAIADNIMEMESRTLPALGICASVSDVTRTQIKIAEANGVTLVQVPVHDILDEVCSESIYVSQVVENLRRGKDTILLSSSTYDRAELELSAAAGARKGMSIAEVSAYVQGLMGRMAKDILTQTEISGAFITGGDTAMGVLRSTGADGSNIQAELTVGIPMMRIVGGDLDGLRMVTKAGAFGREDAIIFAFRKLKEK